jgi:hypothetical protein
MDQQTAQTTAPPGPWLTLPEAAERARISRRGLGRLLRQGLVRKYRPTPGRAVISADELDRAILATADEGQP